MRHHRNLKFGGLIGLLLFPVWAQGCSLIRDFAQRDVRLSVTAADGTLLEGVSIIVAGKNRPYVADGSQSDEEFLLTLETRRAAVTEDGTVQIVLNSCEFAPGRRAPCGVLISPSANDPSPEYDVLIDGPAGREVLTIERIEGGTVIGASYAVSIEAVGAPVFQQDESVCY